MFADRATNPTKFDVSQLYSEWQKKELGDDSGKGMFDQLQAELSVYNDACGKLGGKAKLQFYQVAPASSGDSDNEVDPPPKKKHCKQREQPIIIAVCTPLMSRVYEHIQQAGETIFCDSMHLWTGSIPPCLFCQLVIGLEECHLQL